MPFIKTYIKGECVIIFHTQISERKKDRKQIRSKTCPHLSQYLIKDWEDSLTMR